MLSLILSRLSSLFSHAWSPYQPPTLLTDLACCLSLCSPLWTWILATNTIKIKKTGACISNLIIINAVHPKIEVKCKLRTSRNPLKTLPPLKIRYLRIIVLALKLFYLTCLTQSQLKPPASLDRKDVEV